MDQYPSMAWHSASSPVAAVTNFGNENVSAGSTNAWAGYSESDAMGPLMPFSVSSSTENGVTSEPVPAVVGMATTGKWSAPNFRPSEWKGRTLPSSVLHKHAAAFAQSIGLPPPMATTTSAWCPRMTSANASTLATVGFGCTSVNTGAPSSAPTIR